MKKIIALTLILATVAVLFTGCASSKGVKAINECYERSYPHKIYVKSTQQTDEQTLFSETTLTRGTVGSSFVAKKVAVLESYRSVEDGSGDNVYGPIAVDKTEIWYKEGQGTSTDKGANWDAAGENFFPKKGEIAIEFKESLMKNSTYEGGVLSFTVEKKNTKEFFGNNTTITEDVKVEIVTAGGVVTQVKMSWVEPANAATGVGMTTVEIEATYIYDQQNITLN